jgi:hypothetical protein
MPSRSTGEDENSPQSGGCIIPEQGPVPCPVRILAKGTGKRFRGQGVPNSRLHPVAAPRKFRRITKGATIRTKPSGKPITILHFMKAEHLQALRDPRDRMRNHILPDKTKHGKAGSVVSDLNRDSLRTKKGP